MLRQPTVRAAVATGATAVSATEPLPTLPDDAPAAAPTLATTTLAVSPKPATVVASTTHATDASAATFATTAVATILSACAHTSSATTPRLCITAVCTLSSSSGPDVMTSTGTLCTHCSHSVTTRATRAASLPTTSTPWLVTTLRASPVHVSRKRGTSNLTAP